jgi:hypothetical protein
LLFIMARKTVKPYYAKSIDDPHAYDRANISALPWWDEAAYRAAESRRDAVERPNHWSELMDQILNDPTVGVEFGYGGPFIPSTYSSPPSPSAVAAARAKKTEINECLC